MPQDPRRLATALLILRIPLGLFVLQWGVEKFVVPQSAAGIAKYFYGIDLAPWLPPLQGAFQIALALALLLGVWRRFAYPAAIAMHSITTLATIPQLLTPYTRNNHLFFTGVPVLAAFVVLYLLRTADRYTLDARLNASNPAVTSNNSSSMPL